MYSQEIDEITEEPIMILHLQQVIDSDTIDAVKQKLAPQTFSAGTLTAGWAAKPLKNNQQLEKTKAADAVIQLLLKRLRAAPGVESALRPKQFARVMINRYTKGEFYGLHMDDALMSGTRTDISFTLGLTALTDYQGGELTIDDSSGQRSWRLDAGDLLIYPSHYLHQVEPVTAGERLAMVGWVQSFIRDPQQREILFELQTAVSTEHQTNGHSEQFFRLTKSYQNLLRRWLDD